MSGVELWLVRFARFALLRASCDCLVMGLRAVTENHRSNTLSIFLCQGGGGCMDHCLFASRVLIACFACLSAGHFVPSPRVQQGEGRRALQPGGVLGACAGRRCKPATAHSAKPLRAVRSAPSTALGPCARSPGGSRDSAGVWATDYGRRASLMEVRTPLRNLTQGHAAATHQLVMEELLSAHRCRPALE